ncbi:MAG: ABC transporter permease [Phycisphaerae bacterium]|nr:ABC transporter permease [Tepidisphaeraceae bacterium]
MTSPTPQQLPLSYANPGAGGGVPRFSPTTIKVFGILGLLIAVCLITGLIEPIFFGKANMLNLVRRTGLYGILGIGVAFVIITGGIDLSIGSVVALTGCLLPHLLVERHWSVPTTLTFLIGLSAAIGLFHGLMITKMKLQPFIVTLCGLMIYRGFARGTLADQTQGFQSQFTGLKESLTGDLLGLPVTFLIMIALAVAASVFLNRTVWGRYLFALGRNEQAARYSGINTDRMVILAYVICSVLSGFGGILFMLDTNSGQPVDFGNVYELYAISAAVLGGCSLKGGEGTILGVIIGTAVMRVIYNSINLLPVLNQHQQWEFAIVGGVLLAGVTADELTKRYSARRRAARAAAA